MLQQNDDTSSADITDLQAQVDNLHTEQATADVAVTAGQIVRKTGAATIALAQADSISNAAAIGAATANIAMSATGRYRYTGEVTRAGWGLTPGAIYYLSAVTPGEIVSAPDSDAAGAVVLVVGRAKTATTLLVDIELPILL